MDAKKIAEHTAGLGGEDDWYHRDALKRRLQALDEDEPMFGLVPAEKQEQAAIRAALATKETEGE